MLKDRGLEVSSNAPLRDGGVTCWERRHPSRRDRAAGPGHIKLAESSANRCGHPT